MLVAIAGWIIALIKFDPESNFRHGIVGTAVMVLGLLQSNAFLRPKHGAPYRYAELLPSEQKMLQSLQQKRNKDLSCAPAESSGSTCTGLLGVLPLYWPSTIYSQVWIDTQNYTQ